MSIRRSTASVIVLSLLLVACSSTQEPQFRDGDILFQDFPSPQSEAVKLATKSKYSHVGVVFIDNGQPMVWEAVQPVKITPAEEWIARDPKGHYVLKRLRGADTLLTPQIIEKMKSVGMQYMGKNYDPYFGWADDRLYCSELVWKIYHNGAGVDLGQPHPMRDFNLSDPLIQTIIRERYGDSVPLDQPVVAPSDLFHCQLLQTVYVN